MLLVGVDIGGTFTDLLAYDTASGQVRSTKSPTTCDDLAHGVLDCIRAAAIDPAATADLRARRREAQHRHPEGAAPWRA